MFEELPHKDKRYRYSLDIVRDMLLVATEKVRKTRIMYQANLSYRHMERYLKGLLDSGLIECDDYACYIVTTKGKEFLQMYNEYLERQRRIHEEIKGASKDRLLLETMCFNNSCFPKQPLIKKRADVESLGS